MTTKRPYDNCEIYSPDDKLLGFCSQSKFDWYLSKNLAEKISDGKLKLKFEPKQCTSKNELDREFGPLFAG